MSQSAVIEPTDATEREVDNAVGMLNPRQLLFVETLVADREFSISNAAEKAGYSNPGTAGAKLLKNPKVLLLLGKAIHDRSKKNGIDADRVLNELASIAFSNPQDVISDDGMLLRLKDMPRAVAASIREIKVVSRQDGSGNVVESTTELKFWDKLDALHALARHVGILEDQVPQLNVVHIDWDALIKRVPRPDPIEEKIKSLEYKEVVDNDSNGKQSNSGNGQQRQS